MSLMEAYILRCEACSALQAYDARVFLPQDVFADATLRRGWSVHGERSHCDSCPRLCHLCGTEVGIDAWCPRCAVADGQG